MLKRSYRIRTSDIIIGAILVVAGIFVAYRIRVGLNYTWHWEKIPQFIFRHDAESNKWVSNILMVGLYNTIRLSLWGIILATVLGTVMGILRSTNVVFLRLVSGTYVELMRNVPPLIIIFIVYFFLADQVLPSADISDFLEMQSETFRSVMAFCFAPAPRFAAFISALLTMAIFEGAYITEIVRSGIQSIHKGQREASYSLGLSWYQQMRHIILPQAYRRILPPMAGQFISLIKDSSIVSVISIQELTFQGTELMTSTLLTMEIWITVTIMYLMLTLPCSLIIERVEMRLAASKNG